MAVSPVLVIPEMRACSSSTQETGSHHGEHEADDWSWTEDDRAPYDIDHQGRGQLRADHKRQRLGDAEALGGPAQRTNDHPSGCAERQPPPLPRDRRDVRPRTLQAGPYTGDEDAADQER